MQLLGKCQLLAQGRKKFRFRNKLYSFDSTTIDLCLSMFDWGKRALLYVPMLLVSCLLSQVHESSTTDTCSPECCRDISIGLESCVASSKKAIEFNVSLTNTGTQTIHVFDETFLATPLQVRKNTLVYDKSTASVWQPICLSSTS